MPHLPASGGTIRGMGMNGVFFGGEGAVKLVKVRVCVVGRGPGRAGQLQGVGGGGQAGCGRCWMLH